MYPPKLNQHHSAPCYESGFGVVPIDMWNRQYFETTSTISTSRISKSRKEQSRTSQSLVGDEKADNSFR